MLGRSFPIILDSADYLAIRIDYLPRAVRTYYARMAIHYSKPCNAVDTTVIVFGNSFAPAFGLSFNFNNDMQTDTFRVVNCDTLYVPVCSSRNIPADIIDIKCRIGYNKIILILVLQNQSNRKFHFLKESFIFLIIHFVDFHQFINSISLQCKSLHSRFNNLWINISVGFNS